jgi:RNA polymerase sigma-70 factor (ECF subfamily)
VALDRAETTTTDAAAERAAWFVDIADAELDRAYRLAGLILGSFADAEDVTHDAWIRAWDRLDTLRDASDARAWFDRILVNLCRDRLRRSRIVRFVPVNPDDGNSVAEDRFEQLAASNDLVAAIRTLDPDLRIAVVLRFWADLSVDEIARRVGVPPGTVKSRLHRAVARVREQLSDPPSQEPLR